ncbi:hypothetical protein ARMGADRAFT_1032346 [Armillaria gallica]|uniref:Uncharacterized protein n=1 Tax=Armillaria gallica TaxID=47427 RepID=A0A2H3DRE9_ARMGA|nr:hypothetical protein ARMGADRAFT_1032346 [Armillaria gallica]
MKNCAWWIRIRPTTSRSLPFRHVLKIVSKSKHERTKGPLNSVTLEDILEGESSSHHIKSGKADKADARQQQAIPRDAMCNSGRLGRKATAGTPSCVRERPDAETGDSFE